MSNTVATRTGRRIAFISRDAEHYRNGLDASLDAWYRWLDIDDNAEIFALWRTIEELIDTRERGEWQHRETGFSADDLRTVLHDEIAKHPIADATFVHRSTILADEEQLKAVFGDSIGDVGSKTAWLMDRFSELLGVDISPSHIQFLPVHGDTSTFFRGRLKNQRSSREFFLVRDGWERLDISERFIRLSPSDALTQDAPHEIHMMASAFHLREQLEATARGIRVALGLVEEADLDTEAIKAQELIGDLSNLGRRERIMHARTMFAALSFTGEGHESLARLLEAPEHPLSPERLLHDDGDGDEDDDENFLQLNLAAHEDREAAAALAELLLEWTPVLMRQTGSHPERMIEASCRVLGSLLPESRNAAAGVLSALGTGTAVTDQTVKVFKEFLDQAEQDNSGDLDSISSDDRWELKAVVYDVGVLVQISKVFTAAWSLHDSRKAEDAVKLTEESIKAAKGIWELGLKDLEKRAPASERGDRRLQRQKWLLRRVNLIIGVYDTIGYTLRATEAARSGETMQATGYGAQALGTAGGMLAALLKAKKLALLAGWVGWISLALVITGWWIVRRFHRTAIEKALARSAFGNDPYQAGHPVLELEGRSFRWLKPNGAADYTAQSRALRSFPAGLALRGWQEEDGGPAIKRCWDPASVFVEGAGGNVGVLPLTLTGPLEALEAEELWLVAPRKLVYLRGWYPVETTASNDEDPAPAFVFTVPLYSYGGPNRDLVGPDYPRLNVPGHPLHPPTLAVDDTHYWYLRNHWEDWFYVHGMHNDPDDGTFNWDIKLRFATNLSLGLQRPGVGIPTEKDIDHVEAVLLDPMILEDESMRHEVGLLRTGDQLTTSSPIDELVDAGLGLGCAQKVKEVELRVNPCPDNPSVFN